MYLQTFAEVIFLMQDFDSVFVWRAEMLLKRKWPEFSAATHYYTGAQTLFCAPDMGHVNSARVCSGARANRQISLTV